MRILLIEDDTMIGKAVHRGLAQAGFTVDWVTDGRSAELALANGVYDLAILDLGLPKKDGMAILTSLRGLGNSMPVLIASARDTVQDRIAGLEAGADDYVLKPFEMAELLARMRVALRRRAGSAESVLSNGEVRLDLSTRQASIADQPDVQLSAREFALLQTLLVRPGAILSRGELEDRIYGWGEEVESNAVEFIIHALRRKLGSQVIRNVRGLGWRVSKSE